MTLAVEVARMLADDFYATHGLQDVRQGVTREGYAKSKLRLAERIVAHVQRALIPETIPELCAGLCEPHEYLARSPGSLLAEGAEARLTLLRKACMPDAAPMLKTLCDHTS